MIRKQNVMSEVYIHFILYNLRRSASIVNPEPLIERLKALKSGLLAFFSTTIIILAHRIKFYLQPPEMRSCYSVNLESGEKQS